MTTIEAQATVTPDGKLSVQTLAPENVQSGEYRVVIMIDEQQSTGKEGKFEFPVHDVGPWPENLSLRREDMYDEWGR